MDAKDQETFLNDVDRRIERLRASYDQYFIGLERTAPQDRRVELERKLRQFRTEHVRNTATRFRFQTLLARFVTYSTYWDRITRQIEEGTFKRDVDRARRRTTPAGAGRARDVDIDIDVDLDFGLDTTDDDLDAQIARAIEDADEVDRLSLPALTPPPPAPARPAAGPPGSLFALDDIDSTVDGFGPSDTLPPPPPSTPLPVPTTTTQQGRASARFARPKDLGPSPTASPVRLPTPVPAAPDAARSRPAGSAHPKQEAPTARPPPAPPRHATPPPSPSASGPRPAPARPAPAATSDDDAAVRAVYSRYIEMRRQCNEPTHNVKMETLARSLRDLRAKHGDRPIDFEVVVKNGRAAIKPVPK